MSVEEALDSLEKTANRIADERNMFRDALQALYDASPTSCDDKALNEAQIQAEKALGIAGR